MALDLPSYLMGKSRGGGGTSDYSQLINKPSINGVTLSGNKTGADLSLQDVVQYSTMPTASADYLGKIVQFIGTTDSTYTKGYFYVCVSDGQSTPTYSWTNINTQKGINFDLRILSVRNTPNQKDLAEASKLINDMYEASTNWGAQEGLVVIASSVPNGNTYGGNLFVTKFPAREKFTNKNTQFDFIGNFNSYSYETNPNSINRINGVTITGSWSGNTFTASNIQTKVINEYTKTYLATNNTSEYTPTQNYHPATKKYVDDNANPEVTIDTTSTSIAKSSVSKNQVWKYGTLSSLSFGGVKNFDKETIFYFTSGSPGTNISLPTDLVNLGDVPTLTLVSDKNTGTCDTNKNYIIAICNKIAVWKKY